MLNSIEKLWEKHKPLMMLLYLSGSGMALVLCVQVYFLGKVQASVALTFMAVIFGIYTMNRYTDMMEDFTNDLQKYLFFKERQYLLYLGVLCLVGSLGFLALEGRLHVFHLAIVLSGMAYSYRIIPWYRRGSGFTFMRAKELILIKNIVVSLSWGLSVFAFPLLYDRSIQADPVQLLVLSGALILSTFANSVFNDVLDCKGDKLANNETFVTRFGISTTLYSLGILTIGWLGVIGWLLTQKAIETGLGLFVFLLHLYPMVYIGAYFGRKKETKSIAFLTEGDLFLFAAGIILLAVV